MLGASGLVGGVLWSALSARHDVVGTYATRAVRGLTRLDLRDETALRRWAADGFDLVIHAAGLVDLVAAEADPALAHALNVRPVQVLTHALRGSATKLLFLSTDNVFDGTADSYTEHDQRSPVNAYGRFKAAAEDMVLADGRHLVVRLPIVYGRSPWTDRFMARFAGPTTPAQTDLVCTPLYLPSLAPALEKLADRTGVLHLAGPEILTRYALLSLIGEALGLPTRVEPVREADSAAAVRRPRRLVLRSVLHTVRTSTLSEALASLTTPSRTPLPGPPQNHREH